MANILAEISRQFMTHLKVHIYEHRLPQMIGYVFQKSLKMHEVFRVRLEQLMIENTSELDVLNSQGASTTIIRVFIVLYYTPSL